MTFVLDVCHLTLLLPEALVAVFGIRHKRPPHLAFYAIQCAIKRNKQYYRSYPRTQLSGGTIFVDT